MSHPMSEAWLDWQPIATFPDDGDGYLAIDNRIDDGFPQVVFWDDGNLHVTDSSIIYSKPFFTHWARIPKNWPPVR